MNGPGEPESTRTGERSKGKVAVSEMAGDLRLELGDKVLLTLEGSKDRIRAEIVGRIEKEFLIAHLAPSPGIREKFYQGAPLLVRFLDEGMIIGFKSCVINFILRPRPLLILEYPMMIDKVSLRNDERFECSIPCVMQTKFERVEAVIIDLSRGGCKISCDAAENKDCTRLENSEVGEMIVLMFEADNEGTITLSGKIKNKAREGLAQVFGVSYTKLSNDIFDKLDSFISRRLAPSRR